MGGNHIDITGNNNNTVVDSHVGSIAGADIPHSDILEGALKEMAAFIRAERSPPATAAFQQMECALAKASSGPETAQSHWRSLVAALPTIMQIPATLTVIRALFQD